MGTSSFRIRLLGPLEVLDGEAQLKLPPSRKARALLAYLVVTGRPQARSALCDLLWRDTDDPRAGLRWALSKLRRVLHVGRGSPIATDRNRVGFDGEGIEVDLWRVASLVPHDPERASTEELQEAVRAFRGDFVEGLELPRCHDFEAWCLGVRDRHRRLHLSLHAVLADRLRHDPDSAISHALARLSLDPYSEKAYVAAMEVVGREGRRDHGLELYERCRRMLRTHLRTSPSEALEAARLRLVRPARKGRGDPGPGAGRSSDLDQLVRVLGQLPAPDHLPPLGPGDPALVGRDDEMRALTRTVERSLIGASDAVVLVAGEAGIGKTRLLREGARLVRGAGGWVLGATVFEPEEVRPYGPWIDLLRQVPPEALDEEALRGLSGLVDESVRGPYEGGPTERGQLFEALTRLLERMAGARTPALVVLDDVQWLDPSSTALLHYVARRLRNTPLILALAAREEEIGSGTRVGRMLLALEQAGHLDRIGLVPLDARATEALVRSVDAGLDTQHVHAASEGNPYFTLALAASLREGFGETPSDIREELRRRLDRLTPGARSLLPWAAALGRAFELPTLVRVGVRPAGEIVDALQELEERGIVRPAGKDRFHFTHSLLRQAAYRRPSEPVRRQIHRSIAASLDEVGRTGERRAGTVAHHAEMGGLPDLAAAAYAEAAEASLWVFAFDEAAILVERGLAQIGELSTELRLSREMSLLRIYSFRSMRDRRPGDLELRVARLTDRARVRGNHPVVAMGHACLTELQYQRGAYGGAGRHSRLSATAAREGGPATAARALSETAACLLLLDQAPDDARRMAAEAAELAEENGLRVGGVALARALLHHHDGEFMAASAAYRELVDFGRRARDRWWETQALNRMVMVELDRAEDEGARALAREATEVADRMDDEVEGAFARGLAAVAATRTGEPAALDEVLQELRELDSLWKVAQIQVYAAETELGRKRADAAGTRAREAFEAARVLGRPSLLALSRALLARAAALSGDPQTAFRHLGSPEVSRPEHHLSHRARKGIERARQAIRSP